MRRINGVSTILSASRVICRMVGVYGTTALAAATTAELAAAVQTLRTACLAFDALDDQAGEIDAVAPIRAGEDRTRGA
jgi:hypothetical protein